MSGQDNYNSINKPTVLKEILHKKDKSISELEESQRATNDEIATLKEENDRIVTENATLKSRVEEALGRITEINDFYGKIDRIREEIVEAHDLIVNDNDEGESLKTQIQNYREELLEGDDSIQSSIAGAYETIQNYSKAVFGSTQRVKETDEQTGESVVRDKKIPGFKKNLEDFLKESQETVIQRTTALEDLYKKYDMEIANLLPGALSAGLSSAHHKTSEFHEGEARKSQDAFRYTICALVFCGVVFFALSIFAAFKNIGWASDPGRLLVRSMPISLPLIWLAISFQLSVKRHTRLHSEYKHKENLCKTFEGLRKAAQGKENKALEDQLLSAMIRANEYNPSQTLDGHKADTPISALADSAGEKLLVGAEKLGKAVRGKD